MIDIAKNVVKNLPSEQNNGKSIDNFYNGRNLEKSDGLFASSTGKYSGETYIKDPHKVAGESGSIDMSNSTYAKPGKQQEEDFVVDSLSKDSQMDAETRQRQMVVLSNTTSAEDYRKMKEDGFSLAETDSQTIITETDKIKAVLAKAGADTSIYGDDLDANQLEEITGSAATAAMIMQTLERNDLPATKDNVSEIEQVIQQAQNIGTLGDEAMSYMLKNDLEPTIENMYKAKHSGATEVNIITDEDFEGLKEQLTEIITEAGMVADDEALDNSKWLIENQIAVTGDNLEYLADLKEFSKKSDLSDEEIIGAAVKAIAEGNRPEEGMLIEGYSTIEKAEHAVNIIKNATPENIAYLVANDKEITIQNLEIAEKNNYVAKLDETNFAQITAQRKLEEVRLAMTTEANYALLKKGISIDTKPLEELVESLKEQENSYYKNLLDSNGVESTDENVQTFKATYEAVEQIKFAPAYALELHSTKESLEELTDRAATVQADFEKANKSYETMMTAPRGDLGDSIIKAFRNVDDILVDLDMEVSEENQRAVRILAYNETEINTKNVEQIKAVDEEVQRAFANLTPKTTLEMIRRGIDPLNIPIEELNDVATEIKKQLEESDNEKFSKYLWKLEQNREISEEERSSYIGIYRLIAQVEKTDGAVIGSLINQGVDITMKNLLTAVRNQKKSGMEYTIDDDFGGVDSKLNGEQIDSQIKAAYEANIVADIMDNITPEAVRVMNNEWENMTPEQFKKAILAQKDIANNEYEELENQYAMEQISEYEEAVNAGENIYAFLDRYDVPNTILNIMSATRMLRQPNQMMERLWKEEGLSQDSLESISWMKEEILERFGEAIKTPAEMTEAEEALEELATKVMKTMIEENEKISALDLKELRLMNNELSLCAKKAKEESYMVPVQTGDSVTGVSLKVIRGKADKGLVDIFFRGELMGKVAASFEAKEQGVSGVIAVSDEETRQLLSDNLGLLAQNLNNEGKEAVDLRVALIPELSSERFEASSLQKELNIEKDETSNKENTVQTSRLYHIAEGFIQMISELTN